MIHFVLYLYDFATGSFSAKLFVQKSEFIIILYGFSMDCMYRYMMGGTARKREEQENIQAAKKQNRQAINFSLIE